MKIKRITPTNQYKEVEFSSLLNNFNKKILTPSGFVPIRYFYYVKTGPTIKITTKNGVIDCDPQHRILTNNGERYVKDLSIEDKIMGYKGELLDYSLESGGVADLYDIEIDSPHWYYTSGLISHNSIALPNVGASNLRQGSNILHVTCEMTWKQTALRYMALLSQIPYKQRFDPKSQSQITQVLARIKDSYNSELIIVDFPPDEISVDVIAAKVDQLRKLHGIQIDVIIIDYLELLLSRNPYFNRDEYLKQKRVGTEIDRLGKKTNTAVFTATQTRRSGNEQNQDKGAKNTGAKLIDIADVAESYGKTMPMHYIVTINQTKGEYESGRQGGGRVLDLGDNSEQVPNTNAACRLYVVKNRNGRQFITINARINYETMTMKEADNMSSDTIRTKDNV